MPFHWVDVEDDPLIDLLEGVPRLADRPYPLALFADGSLLEGPRRFMRTRYVRATPTGAPSPVPPEDEQAYAETASFKQRLAERVGLPTRPTREAYDIVIVGAGPAGLTAALYAASEGQAEILIGAELLTAASTNQGSLRIELTGGSGVEARTAIAATGVQYRRLDAPGVDEFVGAGVHYGSAPGEAVGCSTVRSARPGWAAAAWDPRACSGSV